MFPQVLQGTAPLVTIKMWIYSRSPTILESVKNKEDRNLIDFQRLKNIELSQLSRLSSKTLLINKIQSKTKALIRIL